MRVLLVSPGYPPERVWGTETYAREVARGLAARGHEPVVFHPREVGAGARATGAGGLSEELRDGIRVVGFARSERRGKALRASYEDAELERAFAVTLARTRPDRVHFLHLLWNLSLRLPELARERGLASALTLTDLGLVCHRGQMSDHRLESCRERRPGTDDCARCIREPAPFDGSRTEVFAKRLAVRALWTVGGLGRLVTARDVELRAQAVRRALAHVDRVVAPTRALADVVELADLARPDVLPYALDERPLRAARATPGGPVRIRFLGQLAPHKGPDTLVRAAARLAERADRRAYSIHLHGAPSDRHRAYGHELARRARSAGVRLEAPFAPGALPGLLADTAILAIPSQWLENAPFAALQARAAGVPIVASDVPGLREVIEPGRHGWLFPAGDGEALAARLDRLIQNGPRRMPEPGLPLSLEQHLDRLEELYCELGDGRPEVAHRPGAVALGDPA